MREALLDVDQNTGLKTSNHPLFSIMKGLGIWAIDILTCEVA
jgi:hypothetical protein